MSDRSSIKVFLVVAGGNPAAEKHFGDTIQRKRTRAAVEFKLEGTRFFLEEMGKDLRQSPRTGGTT